MRLSFLPLLLPAVSARGLFEPDTGMLRHRADLIQACADLQVAVPLTVQTCTAVTLLGIKITVDINALPSGIRTGSVSCTLATSDVELATMCLCTNAGALTPASVLDVETFIAANGPTVKTVTSTANGVQGYTSTSLLNYITTTYPSIVEQQGSTCNYPTDAIPRDCGTCNYDCPADTYLCGNACVSTTKMCISGMPVRKRSRLGERSDLCPLGLTACSLPGRRGFECLNAKVDLESCGGCAFPQPGKRAGVDCTAISQAINVECQSGACVVKTCARGWEPSENQTECVQPGAARLVISSRTFVEEEKRAEELQEEKKRKGREVIARRQLTTARLRARYLEESG